jgi:hypothetical protein
LRKSSYQALISISLTHNARLPCESTDCAHGQTDSGGEMRTTRNSTGDVVRELVHEWERRSGQIHTTKQDTHCEGEHENSREGAQTPTGPTDSMCLACGSELLRGGREQGSTDDHPQEPPRHLLILHFPVSKIRRRTRRSGIPTSVSRCTRVKLWITHRERVINTSGHSFSFRGKKQTTHQRQSI